MAGTNGVVWRGAADAMGGWKLDCVFSSVHMVTRFKKIDGEEGN